MTEILFQVTTYIHIPNHKLPAVTNLYIYIVLLFYLKIFKHKLDQSITSGCEPRVIADIARKGPGVFERWYMHELVLKPVEKNYNNAAINTAPTPLACLQKIFRTTHTLFNFNRFFWKGEHIMVRFQGYFLEIHLIYSDDVVLGQNDAI